MISLQRCEMTVTKKENLKQGENVFSTYTNYRGETSKRHVKPIEICFTSTKWYPETQWLLKAYDLKKKSIREFSFKYISNWS